MSGNGIASVLVLGYIILAIVRTIVLVRAYQLLEQVLLLLKTLLT